jgi:hypothetical protein
LKSRSISIVGSFKSLVRRARGAHPILQLIWLESLRVRSAWNLWRYDDLAAITKLYKDYSGRKPNLDRPIRFSEKLQWLKLNHRLPVQSILADKYAVRAWLKDRGYEELLAHQFACISDIADLDFDTLPDRFVLKAAHASGWNLICSDKGKLNRRHTRRIVSSWLTQSIFWNGREWPYRNMPRRVVIEEYLEDASGGLRDYKFYCFNGEPRFLQANSGRHAVEHAQNFYSLDWQLLPFGKDLRPRPDIEIPRPVGFETMVRIARDLSAGHPFLRVDLYNVDGRLVFGELTFFPASGLPDFIPDDQDFACGELLILP